MQYGLIGEHLGHSYSVPIHRMISGEDYELREIAPADLGTFMTRRAFRAVLGSKTGKDVVIPLAHIVVLGLGEIVSAHHAYLVLCSRSLFRGRSHVGRQQGLDILV